MVSFTNHAIERGNMRNVSEDEIRYVIKHGQKSHNAGCIMFFLGKRDIPPADRADQRICQLEGTGVKAVLTTSKRLLVLTAIRNRRRGLKDHRRKKKYARRR